MSDADLAIDVAEDAEEPSVASDSKGPVTTVIRKILVVDDSAAMRQQVRRVLEGADWEIVEAVDGADGLDKLLTMTGFSLVLCDVNMPNLNGIELVQAAMRAAVDVPILMLTTESQAAVIRQARAAGARGWIVKPFKPEMLLGAVNKLARPR
jgi:two-component system chemotaxis response regulator CheY